MDVTALAALVARTGDLAEHAGHAEPAARLRAMNERLREQRVYVAVLGQFKRGKSTLVNALLGEEVLPSSVIPLTAVPTVLRHGPVRSVEVRFLSGRPAETHVADSAEQLLGLVTRFVAEKANPRNVLNVAQVEVLHPARVLEGGLVLVDTPGIGSTLEHNTAATINFLPECDAAIFVMSPDPPLTSVEREFLKVVRARASRLYYVLTKADYVSAEECDELLDFLTDEMAGGPHSSTEIMALSARMALGSNRPGERPDREGSGIEALERVLEDFTRSEMTSVLQESFARRLGEVLEEMRTRVVFERGLLTTPLDELEARGRQFREKLQATASERRVAHDLIAGDKRRLLDELDSEAQACTAAATDHLNRAVATAGGKQPDSILAEATPPYFEGILGDFSRRMSERVGEALESHQRRADGIIDSVRDLASDLFSIEYAAPAGADAFEARREPYWVTHEWQVSASPVDASAIDTLLPKRFRAARQRKRVEASIEQFVVSNVAHIHWAILQNLNDSVLRFSASLDRRLAQIVDDIERALDESAQRQRQGSASVEPRIAFLDEVEVEIRAVSVQLANEEQSAVEIGIAQYDHASVPTGGGAS